MCLKHEIICTRHKSLGSLYTVNDHIYNKTYSKKYNLIAYNHNFQPALHDYLKNVIVFQID